MARGTNAAASVSKASGVDEQSSIEEKGGPQRSSFLWLALFLLLVNGSWAVYSYQYESLPSPVSVKQAGLRGFSEFSALAHVMHLADLGPHPVGSDTLDLALKYVLAAAENIKQKAHWEVDVQVDFFHAKTGANRLVNGLFKGKTLVYSDMKHVILRLLPKYQPEAEENVVLVSSHIDTVFSTGGAGDCSSCVGVMLELARAISHWAHGFKNGVIFLFNTGEEEGLNGAHSFITQHPWSNTIRFMVDLEAMGIGGKSAIFQGSYDPWAIETFARAAKYPSAQVVAQDIFRSGLIKSGTDFQVYEEVAGLPGLDFAYMDSTAVYHTKNDKLKLLKPGSLQHLGENMLAFLREACTSPHLHKKSDAVAGTPIFFDILGSYMVVYTQGFASMLYNSVILQAVLIWITSLLMGGYPGGITFGLSCLNIILMWIFSLSFSLLVAFLLPLICYSPLPYIANPWLVSILFGVPAVLGALTGQHITFLLLQKHLQQTFFTRMADLSPYSRENVIKLESERWIFKGGFIQSLILLIIGHCYKVGSSYIALIWLVSPAFAYGLMEATLSPLRLPKKLKIATLLVGLGIPLLVSSGIIFQLLGTLIGTLVRFDRNPGGTAEWFGNLIIAVYVSAVVCFTLTYILSYIHISGAKKPVVISSFLLLALSLAAVSTGVLPTFTEDIARTVNVVHVVEAAGKHNKNQEPSSYISLFSSTPGRLTKETESLKDEGFTCGRNKSTDFVTFTVKYGCSSFKDSTYGWDKAEIPSIDVESDSVSGIRQTQVSVDTKHSTRWAIAINTNEIGNFTLEANGVEIVPLGGMIGVDGWHTIQFAGGKNSPTKFHLNLLWRSNVTKKGAESSDDILLKLRTDVNRLTPIVTRALEKLPPWCSPFGKSTSPFTLAFLANLPVLF